VTKPHAVVLATVALAVAVSIAGCTSVTEDAAVPTASSQATSSPGPDTSAPGDCRFIDKNQAAQLLGVTPTFDGKEPAAGGLVRVDSCGYRAATAFFGYAVDDYSAADKTAAEDLEQLRSMAHQLGDEVLPATVPGADASLAFASKSHGQSNVKLFFVKKSYLVGISVVLNDKAAATAAAQASAAILLDAVS
jgi:hypothetical protein